MIGIEIINSTNPFDFGDKLEIFLNEHPEAKFILGSVKGIEGGKGVFAVYSYDKLNSPVIEPVKAPKPKKVKKPEPLKTPEELEREQKLAEIERLKKEIGQ